MSAIGHKFLFVSREMDARSIRAPVTKKPRELAELFVRRLHTSCLVDVVLLRTVSLHSANAVWSMLGATKKMQAVTEAVLFILTKRRVDTILFGCLVQTGHE